LGEHFFDINGDEGLTGNDDGIPVLEHKMISFQELVIDDDGRGFVQQEAGLLVLLIGGIIIGSGAILSFMGYDLADKLYCGVVFISVMCLSTGSDDDVF